MTTLKQTILIVSILFLLYQFAPTVAIWAVIGLSILGGGFMFLLALATLWAVMQKRKK